MRVAAFSFDVTPPIGHPLCGGWITPVKEIVDPLYGKGIVLRPEAEAARGRGDPVVLCVLDWCWIRGEAYDRLREVMAEAAGTRPNRVALQCIHVHDSIMADLEADRILAQEGHDIRTIQVGYFKEVVKRAGQAVREAVKAMRPVTHIGTGVGTVSQVACNRRVLGPDGKVKYWRASSCKDPMARGQPEGLIDPRLKCITFHSGGADGGSRAAVSQSGVAAAALQKGDHVVAALHYYATHPMSYYGQGGVSADFVGMARRAREREMPGTAHICFNGCAGDVSAGKYNDGSPENRPVLAERIRKAMEAAFKAVRPEPIESFEWRVEAVHLPMREEFGRKYFEEMLHRKNSNLATRCKGAMGVVWWNEYEAGRKIDLACLRINGVSVLHLPGEVFIAYQLAAQEMGRAAAKDGQSFVAVAGYGDCGPAYIPTAEAYPQGGYEVGMARCGPAVEGILKRHMQRLLQP